MIVKFKPIMGGKKKAAPKKGKAAADEAPDVSVQTFMTQYKKACTQLGVD